MNWLVRLGRLPRQVIFAIIAAVVTVPLVRPLGLPLRVSPEARTVFQTIEELPPRSVVVLGFDYDPSSMPELQPMARVIAGHVLAKGHRLLAVTNYPAMPALAEKVLNEVAHEHGSIYGQDYANLGFAAGNEAVVIAAGRDFRLAYPRDFRGNATDELPIMKGITNWKQVDYLVDVAHGGTVDYYIRIAGARYGVKIGAGCTAVSIPSNFSYLQSGQLHGLLGGLKGAAEYERLVGKPGFASTGMDAQSMAHLAVILLVLLGNVSYFAGRGRSRGRSRGRQSGRQSGEKSGGANDSRGRKS